jgi:predicted Zn-dependent protease
LSKVIALLILTLICPFISGCVTSEYNLATEKQETYIYSVEREVSLGRSVAQKVEKKFKLADEDMQERITEIGNCLAEISDRQDILYYFKVIKDEEPNALALPGGFIYISDSLIELTDSDDEIAAVLAHEIGHIAARHSVKRMQGNYLYNFLRILSIRVPSDEQMGRKIDYAFGSLIVQYAREDEVEADKLSVRYMERAGFDTSALLRMLDKIEEFDKKKGPRRFTYFKTHPPVATRKGVVRQAITGQIDFEGYINRPETVVY